ncbi:Pentatricopeptide repeat [Quillaja saponaria]|uniref:Pentatricopeptide repeat n=1 Tax=Quillaja saponaria TaxID=32244 RepID=A0AAD7LSR9_QUISA|nr:Pentatricopeptide repeat [Quillaja saponaria]
MALHFLTRRLHKKHPQLFLPYTFNLQLLFSDTPPHSVPITHLFQAFHQKVLYCSQCPPPSVPHFSTLQLFSAQNLSDPVIFNVYKFDSHYPQDPGLPQFLELLRKLPPFPSEEEAMAFLDESGIEANRDLVYLVIWELREEWRLALLAFKWGEIHNCCDEKTCNLMIWVLASSKMFSAAWSLIRDMHRSSMNTRQAMLIMIERYAYANNPAKAIHTFHFMEKFRLTPDQEAFHTVLGALCQHGNTEEAEEFMLINKKMFPLETKSFNIVLNGWCNISVDVFEAKRVWREMSKYCITPDATSYSHMISCFSKVGNLFDSLRLYDAMNKKGWVPGLEVFNSLIHILTQENCLKEALKIVDKLKEKGLQPDAGTYNSMIHPLCEAKKLEEASIILNTMIEENLNPTVETYHAFLDRTDYKGTLEVLSEVRKAGLVPTGETFLMILTKFLKMEQPVNALKMWVEMKRYEVAPSYSHYSIMVEGLARCRWLQKAKEFYEEMRSNGHPEDPKLNKLLQEAEKRSGDKETHVRKDMKDKRESSTKRSKLRSKNIRKIV